LLRRRVLDLPVPRSGGAGGQIRKDWPDPIEGIVPWGELTIEIGAALGEHLGVDWNPREVIHRFRNKYSMKAYLREHGQMRINASRVVLDRGGSDSSSNARSTRGPSS
jgi:hypothetical protein